MESKLRILVGNLEKIPQIRLARANPAMFPAETERYTVYALRDFRIPVVISCVLIHQ